MAMVIFYLGMMFIVLVMEKTLGAGVQVYSSGDLFLLQAKSERHRLGPASSEDDGAAEGSWVTGSAGDAEAHWVPSQAPRWSKRSFLERASDRLDAGCLKRSRWTVLVGDSNMRKIFQTLVTRLKQQEGLELIELDPSKPDTDPRWADREVIHLAGKTGAAAGDSDFRVSFLFFRSRDAFVHHMALRKPLNATADWNLATLLEKDDTPLLEQARPEAQEAEAQVTAADGGDSKYPDTLIFSTGLWDLDCDHVKQSLRALEALAREPNAPRVLYVTAGAIAYHPKITHSDTKRSRDCARDSVAGAALLEGDGGRSVDFLDVWPMTTAAKSSWIDKGGGYHYTDRCDGHTDCDFASDPTPVGRALLGQIWSYLCAKQP